MTIRHCSFLIGDKSINKLNYKDGYELDELFDMWMVDEHYPYDDIGYFDQALYLCLKREEDRILLDKLLLLNLQINELYNQIDILKKKAEAEDLLKDIERKKERITQLELKYQELQKQIEIELPLYG